MPTDATVGGGASVPLDGLAERLRDDDLALAVLTDEELAAIDQPLHPDGPVGWYATLEDHEELLDQDGLHACTLRSPAQAIGGLVARCDPGEVAGDHAGDPIGGQDAGEEVHALADDLLRRASVRTELMLTAMRADRDVS